MVIIHKNIIKHTIFYSQSIILNEWTLLEKYLVDQNMNNFNIIIHQLLLILYQYGMKINTIIVFI